MLRVTSQDMQATGPEGRRVSTEPGTGGTGRAEGLCCNGSGTVLEGTETTAGKVGAGLEKPASSHPRPPTAGAEGRSFPQPSGSSSPEGGLVSPHPRPDVCHPEFSDKY